MKITLTLASLIGAQCPWDGYNGRQAIFDYIACRDGETGTRLSTPSTLGHFRKLDDFEKFPEGVPEGTWCLKMRCNSRPMIGGLERVGCYEGQWLPLQCVPNLGCVPQFGTTISPPKCPEIENDNSKL